MDTNGLIFIKYPRKESVYSFVHKDKKDDGS